MLSVDGQLLLWTVMGVIVTFLLIMACDDCHASACSLMWGSSVSAQSGSADNVRGPRQDVPQNGPADRRCTSELAITECPRSIGPSGPHCLRSFSIIRNSPTPELAAAAR